MYNKKFKKEPTQKQKIGQIGENAVCQYLINKAFKVIDRNYLRKWGELDIVARKGNIIHFIEVKSKTTNLSLEVTHVTDSYRPEDNMHPWKLKRLSRAVQSYLLERGMDDAEWQFDLATVLIDTNKRLSKVTLIEDIVF